MIDKKQKIVLMIYVGYLIFLSALFVWFRQFFQLDPQGAYWVSMKNVIQHNVSFFLVLITTAVVPIVWCAIQKTRVRRKKDNL